MVRDSSDGSNTADIIFSAAIYSKRELNGAVVISIPKKPGLDYTIGYE
jgi:hypothetical protein